KLMFCGEGIGRFQKLVKDYIAEQALARLPTARQHGPFPPAMQVHFFAGAFLSLLAWWLENDMPLSAHQMAHYVLLRHGTWPEHA
ncbi:MAG TPA: TetR-like C-terminal domain-containing protein, partial [Ktedonobacterales bacterium]|nr:TetR-like C-terminal domain-containing protein [Ktedonobacterales bacterium]